MSVERTECSCAVCQRACESKPGWFRPGEAEKAAELMGLSLPEFFRTYLCVDWWVESAPVFVLSPAIHGHDAGAEFPGNPRGECVLFKDGKCLIHAAKPYECAHGNPCEQSSFAPLEAERLVTVELWCKEQQQVRDLLGREPQSEDWYGGFLDFFR